MKKLFFVVLILHFVGLSGKTFAQNTNPKAVFLKSLQFLVQNQCDSTIVGKQYAGEWPVFMNLTEPFAFIGRKQKARDSNCFNVASVHNFLSEIYLKDTSLLFLKPTIVNAFREMRSYEANNGQYNFWKLLPPSRQLRLFLKNDARLVHRPTNYKLKSRLINKTGQTPEDADDTALSNLAIYYHNQIFGDSLKIISYKRFDGYLDQNRKNRNWYNQILPSPKNSGAYMTWLYPEYEFDHWSTLATYLSLAFIFVPVSSAYPQAYKPWIPFGANDVCVVVNAHVMSYLAQTHQIEKSKGKKGGIKVIEAAIKKNQWMSAGIYYPNRYHVDYAVAKAYWSGVVELKTASEKVIQHIVSTQNADGSFESNYYVNKGDKVQSTAYALHALLDLKDSGMIIPDSTIRTGFEFLLKNAKFEGNTCHWDGGVYFSGGTILRTSLFWQSDAYTTAMIAKCLQRYYF